MRLAFPREPLGEGTLPPASGVCAGMQFRYVGSWGDGGPCSVPGKEQEGGCFVAGLGAPCVTGVFPAAFPREMQNQASIRPQRLACYCFLQSLKSSALVTLLGMTAQ